MIRRSFRIGLRLGLLAGIAFAVMKVLQSRRMPEPLPTTARDPWPPVAPPPPSPAPAEHVVEPTPAMEAAPVVEAPPVVETAPVAHAAKKATKSVKKASKAVAKAANKSADPIWVAPQGVVCPLSHPIKAKLSSSIYHLPGMLNYTRTRPDRCYASETAAKRDGLTPAKR